tara:strand:- start:190 stop:636 length:447 start_codon:yes stop_codon:yes gene_type:complete
MIQSDYIKKIKRSDIDEIIQIENDSYKRPWVKEHFEKDINNQCSINYIYKKDKELIGYLFGYLINDEYQLNKITVKAEHRYKKIGKLLFLHCLRTLINLDVKCIQLEVSSLNLIAQDFYKSLGFIKVGLRENYYSIHEDAVLYNLEIK